MKWIRRLLKKIVNLGQEEKVHGHHPGKIFSGNRAERRLTTREEKRRIKKRLKTLT